jgi:putative ABC transport system permease protein
VAGRNTMMQRRKQQELSDAYEELVDAESQIQDARDEVGSLEKPTVYVLDRTNNVGYACFENDTNIVAGISSVFPVFFFLVAALVCVTTMTRMVDEQRTQIGVLKALGYAKHTIMAKFMFYAGSAALLGSVSGFFLGSYIFPKTIWEAYQIMYGFSEISFYFSPALFVISVFTYLLCALGSTWLACNRELSEVPAELIRPKSPKNGKRILLERATFFWRRLKFLHKVSIRNVARYKGRMFMMILGIGGCTALLLTGFGIQDSISNVVTYQYEEITVYDSSVMLSEGTTSEELDDLFEGQSDLKDWLLLHEGTVDMDTNNGTKSVNLLVPEKDDMTGFMELCDDGQPISFPGTGEAVINKNLADIFDLEIGDTFEIRDADLNVLTLTLSGVFDNYVYNYVIVGESTCLDQWGFAPEMKTAYVTFQEGVDGNQAAAGLLNLDDVVSVSVSSEFEDRINNMMSSLDYIVWLIILCAGCLAFVVLYNLTNINITERIREIATLKVLGFNSAETASYVFRESMMLTGLGALVGILLGRSLHAFVMSQIKIDLMSFDIRVAGLSYVWSVLLTFVFACVVNFVMYFKLQRINMAESLKTIE